MRKYISYIVKFKWANTLYNFILLKLHRVSYSQFPDINGRIKIYRAGTLKIGSGVVFNCGKNNNAIGGDTIMRLYVIRKDATLKIGNYVGVSNSTIYCSNSIIIEDNVLIGGGCKLYDFDFHAIDATSRISAFKNKKPDEKAMTAPILIKNGAWIGGHCIVLKGVSIGVNSIIGAGSVVTKNIPDNEIWAGNPIKFLRKL